MRLQHVHLLRPVPYPLVNRIQDTIVRQHIDAGLQRQRGPVPAAAPSSSISPSNPSPSSSTSSNSTLPTPPTPSPFLLTFETTPTYTCGRREIPTIGASRISYLTAGGATGATFHPSLRGGQTTFHGPGQLTAYLILTLKAHSLSPRCYVRFLETSIIDLCAQFSLPAKTTQDPGVWVDDESKICAVGVHMRRGVTSHGIGLNVNTDLGWFERIVACGLEGKRVTSLAEQGVRGLGVREVAMRLAEIVARGLKGVDGIDGVDLAGSAERTREYRVPVDGDEG